MTMKRDYRGVSMPRNDNQTGLPCERLQRQGGQGATITRKTGTFVTTRENGRDDGGKAGETNVFKEKIILEGNQPEKALFRLQKAGIDVYRAKKIKKNQILFTVSKKDSEKVFAIYPKMCYNISEHRAYFCKKAGGDGALRVFSFFKKRLGFVLGAILFLTATAYSGEVVLSFSFTGEKGYEAAALEVFERYGVKKFKRYPRGTENELCAELMKLPQITFASVKKRGTIVTTELRASSFSDEKPKEGSFVCPRDGKLLSLFVLKGTPLKQAGESVKAGDLLVGDYVVTEKGEREQTYAAARATLLCVFEGTFSADSEEDALKKALLFTTGTRIESSVTKTEKGFFVRIEYEFTASFNF